jgi:S-DNA-T family DNA segregation ATPase FtsK/SpoIIIE
MATRRITVSELKCAVADPEWRTKWLAGEKPSTKSFVPPGALPVYGSLFHETVEVFVGWLIGKGAKKAAKLEDRDSLWDEMYDRFAVKKLNRVLQKGKVDSAYHLINAFKSFCRQVAHLRARTPEFRSWHDVYLAKEFPLKGMRIDLGCGSLLISGQLDAVRFHPDHDLEVVDYKLTHGDHMKHDLLQLAIYAKLLSFARPGLILHGTLEYYEPELHEVVVSKEDLEGLFEDIVKPVLYEITGEKLPPSKPREEIPVTNEPRDVKAKPGKKDLSEAIRKCFADFKLDVEVLGQQEAPQLVRYRLKPAPGVKVISLANRADDLKVALSLPQTPLVEPSKGAVVIDIPKKKPDLIYWKDVVSDSEYRKHGSPVSFIVGIGVDNHSIIADFADPNTCHSLVAGASGSGKSEFLKCLVASLVLKNTPENLRLTIIDPKILTFGSLSGLPHLDAPVITDVEAALPHLRDAAEEMDKRYHLLFREGFENLSDRLKGGREDIPYHVIVFDEFADLILSDKKTKKEFETLVSRLAAKGRAAGIHLVLATQRPDRNVVTGLIKANLPLKVCMRVINAANSSIILDQTGAEKLLGRGDLLCDRGKGIERAQSPYITQEEFRKLGGEAPPVR